VQCRAWEKFWECIPWETLSATSVYLRGSQIASKHDVSPYVEVDAAFLEIWHVFE
jgi:hypothetical protein